MSTEPTARSRQGSPGLVASALEEEADMTRSFRLVSGGVVILGLLAMTPLQGSDLPVAETMYLTMNVPTALPGVVLGPGTYIFELAEPRLRTDLVRVLSRDRARVHFIGFTEPIRRPRTHRADWPLALGEAELGAPHRILAW